MATGKAKKAPAVSPESSSEEESGSEDESEEDSESEEESDSDSDSATKIVVRREGGRLGRGGGSVVLDW